jgi:hypothetical protein
MGIVMGADTATNTQPAASPRTLCETLFERPYYRNLLLLTEKIALDNSE